MATENEHERQADHNQKFLDDLDPTKYPDWAATVAFYIAVHRVQALLRVSGDRCKSHQKRNNILRAKFPSVWKHYQPLYSFSRLARYWCMRVQPDHVPYIRRRLGKVEQAIAAEMKHLKKKAAS